MLSLVNVGSLLRQARGLLYRGHLRQTIRRTGLNEVLSGPYWNLIHKLSGDVQTHTIGGVSINFTTDTLSEFKRFQSLVGEEPIVTDVLDSLEPDDIVFDIGANVGTYTCFVASKLGPGRTIAFEPEPQNADRLRENLALNNLDADVIEIALSDTNGTVDFALLGDEAGEGEHAIATAEDAETIEVETACGDDVIEQQGLPRPTVIKTDVEGAELSVLRGLCTILREHVRVIYVEVHPAKLPDFGDSAPEVRAFLEGAGFDVTTLSSRGNELFLRASK